MTKTQKSVLVGLLLWTTLLVPGHTFASTPVLTQAEIDTQRVELIEQLVALLQAKLADLIAQLEAQQGDIATLKANQPVFGGTTQSVQKDFDFNVSSIEFGKGSWEVFAKNCSGENPAVVANYHCNNRYLDGTVRFTLTGEVDSAGITYQRADKSTPAATTWAAFHDRNITVGFFQPNSEYTWSITAKDKNGREATKTGTFKTGDYPS